MGIAQDVFGRPYEQDDTPTSDRLSEGQPAAGSQRDAQSHGSGRRTGVRWHAEANSDEPLGLDLLIAGLEYGYGGKETAERVIQDLSMHVPAGEFLSIVGPSGCGKSTLLSLVAGVLPHQVGEIKVGSETVSGLRHDVGLMFQRDALLPWKKVIDNVGLPLIWRGVSKKHARLEAAEWLERLGLAGYERHYPSQLSGGMRKRVQLAAALIHLPRLLLMDEPFASLDVQTRDAMEDDLLRIWEEKRNTVLFVTHDLEEAIALSDRVIVMSAHPAKIKAIHTVDIPRPRNVMEGRGMHEFQDLYRIMWEDLRGEVARIPGTRSLRP